MARLLLNPCAYRARRRHRAGNLLTSRTARITSTPPRHLFQGELSVIRRRCLVLFSLAACLPAAHASDLMDVFHQAVLHDPTLATADATRLAIAEGVPQARAALLPNLSAELDTQQVRGGSGSSVSGSGQVIDNSSGAVTRERDLTGEVTQNILNLADIAALKAAQSSRDAQE